MDYIPHTQEERKALLSELGLTSEDQLFHMIPDSLKNPAISFPEPMTEMEIQEHMEGLATQNTGAGMISFLGGGAYRHFIPQAVNALISRGDFATAYTPYQAEVSQGTLQHIYEFQTLISNLTGMDVANAGMYDGATAVAESALMACRITRKEKVLYSATINPQHKRVLQSYLEGAGITGVEINAADGVTDIDSVREHLDDETAILLVQHPNYMGILEPVDSLKTIRSESKALLGALTYPHSLGLLKNPGTWGADLVMGDLQPFGLPLSYGGPYAGFLAARQEYIRQLPGRLVGRTTDADGQEGYVLTLQTREQHIRRSKATSNICTNQALCALATTIYMALLGPNGLRRASELSVDYAHRLQQKLCAIEGVGLLFDQPFFNEFAVTLPVPVRSFIQTAKSKSVLAGIELSETVTGSGEALLVCATEMTREHHIDRLAEVMTEALQASHDLATV